MISNNTLQFFSLFNKKSLTINSNFRNFASKLQAASTRNSSRARRKAYGPKVMDGKYVRQGQILLTQKGMASKAGKNTTEGKNCSINAAINGILRYTKNAKGQRTLEVKR